MPAYFAPSAMLPQGWAASVRIEVDGAGFITAVQPDAAAEDAGRAEKAEPLAGPVLPGMPNLHSHAFQRAMAGLAERTAGQASGAGDDFWGWRKVMYGFLAALQPEDVAAIAAQLYLEMALRGYTTVGEFHYLHHGPGGEPYADRAELSHRIIEAAMGVGLGITHLPVLYARGGFRGEPLAPEQRRFQNDVAGLAEIMTALHRAYGGNRQVTLGLALHSLRAVPPEMLGEAVALIQETDGPAPILSPIPAPIHIHVAEQAREVAECLQVMGTTPVAWLLEHAGLDQRWCLVHATYMTPQETTGLAASGAVAGLCPTTEANLGDGLFHLPEYLGHGGGRGGFWGIGSDSHVTVDPREELRWLEYGQRLMLGRRNVATAATAGPDGVVSTGEFLYRAALEGGARALGRPIGRIAPGCRADLLVLEGKHPSLYGKAGGLLTDAYVFAAGGNPVRDVMIGGSWVIREGRHDRQEEIEARYRKTMDRLLG